MIVKELYTTRPDGVKLFLNYSNKGVYIRQDQTGTLYDEAIDPANIQREYTETDEPISPAEEPDETKLKSEAYDYLTGRSAAGD